MFACFRSDMLTRANELYCRSARSHTEQSSPRQTSRLVAASAATTNVSTARRDSAHRMDHNTRKRRRPMVTFTYAVLSSLVIIVGCPHQCFGGIALDVTSPLRSPPPSNAEAQCSFWHDAVEDELVRFVATATFERQLDFTMMVSYNNDYVPFSGCPVEYCSSTQSCTISCNASVAVTSGSTAALFKVTASPYDLRIGDTVVSICINVQPNERLLFVRSPPANITAAQGETVTLEYVAQGYPRPVVYVLTCRGGGGGGECFVQESQNGSFRLSDLAVDTTVCSATASNGIESVSSTPTTINKLAPAAAANSSSSGSRGREFTRKVRQSPGTTSSARTRRRR